MRRPAPATVRRLILVLILVLWELVPRTGLLAELFLPSLSKTLTVLVQNWRGVRPTPCWSRSTRWRWRC